MIDATSHVRSSERIPGQRTRSCCRRSYVRENEPPVRQFTVSRLMRVGVSCLMLGPQGRAFHSDEAASSSAVPYISSNQAIAPHPWRFPSVQATVVPTKGSAIFTAESFWLRQYTSGEAFHCCYSVRLSVDDQNLPSSPHQLHTTSASLLLDIVISDHSTIRLHSKPRFMTVSSLLLTTCPVMPLFFVGGRVQRGSAPPY